MFLRVGRVTFLSLFDYCFAFLMGREKRPIISLTCLFILLLLQTILQVIIISIQGWYMFKINS